MIRFRKLISFVLCLALILSVTSFVAYAQDEEDEVFTQEQIDYYASLGLQGTTVNFYNWGEYISDGSEDSMDVVAEFERLTGAKVNYTNFESNENMYSKLAGGGVSYDVIVPSDYMVERLIDEDMLLPLDFDNIPNISNVREDCQYLPYDPEQEYSVCFNSGYTVLIYNKNLVDEVPDSWTAMWDEKYKDQVLMFNNSRDAFAIAQLILGQSLNTTDEQDWQDAAELLAQQRDNVNPVYVMDEVFNKMESGEYALAAYYVGDYVLMNENNEDLGYVYPKEGVNTFYDAFCIPTCCQNKKGAEALINFMQEPQVAFENEEYIYYASSNKTVMENEDSSLFENEAVYPQETPKCEMFKNLPQNILELQNSLWSSVKSGQLSVNNDKTEKTIYYTSGAVAGGVVIVLGVSIIRKKKRDKEEDLGDLYGKD